MEVSISKSLAFLNSHHLMKIISNTYHTKTKQNSKVRILLMDDPF